MNSKQIGKLKHWTASVFVVTKNKTEWKIALVHHKKLKKWMIPGGHVEDYENPYETALREVKEELGVDVIFHSFRHDSEPSEFLDAKPIPLPEYIVEEVIFPYKDQPGHVHMDCLYIGITASQELKLHKGEANYLKWCTKDELKNLDMFIGTRTLAIAILEKLAQKDQKSKTAEI